MKRSNHVLVAAGAIVVALVSAGPGARADGGPVIAIPGHPEVPVIINGRDASYAIVVGDWGLYRPGAVPVRVYGPPAYIAPDRYGYFPTTGHPPRSGRQEFEPEHRVLPPRAPSYHRNWTSESSPDPATVYPQFAAPQVSINPPQPPQVNVTPPQIRQVNPPRGRR